MCIRYIIVYNNDTSRYHLVLFQPEVWLENPGWCRVLQVATTYLMMTTYFWMLAEGIFLWILLVKPFAEQGAALSGLCIIGWAAPALACLPYVCYRFLFFAQSNLKGIAKFTQ